MCSSIIRFPSSTLPTYPHTPACTRQNYLSSPTADFNWVLAVTVDGGFQFLCMPEMASNATLERLQQIGANFESHSLMNQISCFARRSFNVPLSERFAPGAN